jgi:phosphoglycolate phosphatase
MRTRRPFKSFVESARRPGTRLQAPGSPAGVRLRIVSGRNSYASPRVGTFVVSPRSENGAFASSKAASSHRPEGPSRGSPDRGVVIFDLDGTLLDDIALIGRTAARVLHEAFGTDPAEAEVQYYRTTGKPFELQLAELYPDSTPYERLVTSRKFHEAKVREAYAHATVFPEVPKVLKQLDRSGWTLAVSTGAEREMAELVLEREGIAFFFQQIRGAAQGTKEDHLREYRGLWPHLPLVLVGDSRFDIEAAQKVPGTIAVGRACLFPNWGITPSDLVRWGAKWADYSLEWLPQALDRLVPMKKSRPRARSN